MSFLSGRLASRLCCLLAALGALAGAAHAQTTVGAPDDAAIQLDQSVQALKDEVVQFNRDAQLAEDEFLYPPQSRVSVYVSNAVTGLLLTELRVFIDDKAPVLYTYDEFDSRALLEPGALQRIFHGNVSRGAHRIKADFRGKIVDGKAEGAPVTGGYEGIFDKSLEPAELELRIARAGKKRSAAPGMELREWKAAE